MTVRTESSIAANTTWQTALTRYEDDITAVHDWKPEDAVYEALNAARFASLDALHSIVDAHCARQVACALLQQAASERSAGEAVVKSDRPPVPSG